MLGSDNRAFFNAMELSREELQDVQAAVVYYMHRHVSINNPRYDEYEVILQKLSKSIRNTL